MHLSLPFKYTERKSLVAFLLLFNTFSWYYLIGMIIGKMGYVFGNSEYNFLWFSFSFSIIISIIFGSFLSTKTRFLRIWILFGVLTSLISMVLTFSSPIISLFIICLLGISLGIGLPSCLSYFAKVIPIERRGRMSGTVFFVVLLIMPFFHICMSFLDKVLSAIFVALWRMCLLLGLLLLGKEKIELTSKESVSFLFVLRNRTFYLYFISWLMLTSIESFGAIFVETSTNDFLIYIKVIEPIFAGISALITGIFSDRIGRKRIIIFSFTSLGISFAVLGLIPYVWSLWILHSIITGIALGSLWTFFVIVLWGDMATDGSEKFYALGEIPFFLSEIFSLIFTPYLALIPQSNAFSLAAFFLFIAVIPLLYAPETLPEKKIREIELRLYVEKAKKIKQRYAK